MGTGCVVLFWMSFICFMGAFCGFLGQHLGMGLGGSLTVVGCSLLLSGVYGYLTWPLHSSPEEAIPSEESDLKGNTIDEKTSLLPEKVKSERRLNAVPASEAFSGAGLVLLALL